MSTETATVVWNELLDAYERALDEHELAVHETNGVVDGGAFAFMPPPVVEPIPEAMRARAADLAARTDALIARVTTLADAVAPPPNMARPRQQRGGAAPSFDRRA